MFLNLQSRCLVCMIILSSFGWWFAKKKKAGYLVWFVSDFSFALCSLMNWFEQYILSFSFPIYIFF